MSHQLAAHPSEYLKRATQREIQIATMQVARDANAVFLFLIPSFRSPPIETWRAYENHKSCRSKHLDYSHQSARQMTHDYPFFQQIHA